MPDRITSLVPRPVAVPLGGASYPVWEATLDDLADLQQWLDAKRPDPFTALWEGLAAAGDDEQARDKVLFDAYAEEAEEGVTLDDEEGREMLFGTAAGQGEFLRVCLRRGAPHVDPAAVVADPAFDGAQLAALKRVFLGTDRVGLITQLLGLSRDRARGEPLTWTEAIYEAAEALGVPLREVYAMSLTEFRAVRRGGRPRESSFEGLTQAEAVERQRRMCLARYGKTPEEHFGPPVEFKTTAQVEWEEGRGGGWVRRNGLPGGSV